MPVDISPYIINDQLLQALPDSIEDRVNVLKSAIFNTMSGDISSLYLTSTITGMLGTYRILELLYRTPSNADSFLALQRLDEQLCSTFLSLYIDLIEDLDQKILDSFKKLSEEGNLWNVLSKFTDGSYSMLRRFIFYLDSNFIQNDPYIFWLRIRIIMIQALMLTSAIYTVYYMITGNFMEGEIIKYISYAFLIRLGLFIILSIEIVVFFNAHSLDFILGKWFGDRSEEINKKYNNFYSLILQVASARSTLKSLIVDFNRRAEQLGIKSPYGTYITIEEVKLVMLLDLTDQQRQELFVLLDFDGLQPFLTDPNFIYWCVGDQWRQNGWMVPASIIAAYFTYSGMFNMLISSLVGNSLLTWLSTIVSLLNPFVRTQRG